MWVCVYLFVCSKNVLLANDVGDQCFPHVYGLVGILSLWAEASSGNIGFFKPRPGSWWSKAKRAGLESDLGGMLAGPAGCAVGVGHVIEPPSHRPEQGDNNSSL